MMRAILGALLLLVVAGCSRGGSEGEEAWSGPRGSQLGRYTVELAFEPETPRLGELFVAKATVITRDGVPVEEGRIKIDALMPQHFHGMETRPIMRPGQCDEEGENCTHPGGVYVADGFKFHMGGEWTVRVDIEGPRGRDSTSFIYDMDG